MTRLIQTFIPTIGCLLLIILGLATQSFVPFLSIIFYLGAISFGGFKQTREGLTELWQENTLNVDLLMALAAIGAWLIGDFLEGAMLTFIFCLSGALEEYTTSKSQQEITALMNLQPRKAQRLTANEELEEIAVTDLKINDRVFVPKGGTIPIDGYLESQQATVDEATLSGESVPVEKKIVALQNLMKAGGLNDVQSKDDRPTSVGMNISDIEFRRPIKQCDPELEDVDRIKMILDAYMGGTSKALGKDNAFTRRFDEEYAQYTIDTIDNLKQKVVGGAVDEQEEKEESKEDVESPESGDADEQRTT